jgi:hypothetical protein
VQALGAQRLVIANHGLVQAARQGYLVQLMQLKPEAFGDRAVQLAGTNQRATQAVRSALQCNGKQLMAFTPGLSRQACHDQFVADGQVILQSLAEVGDFTRTLIKDDRLVEEVFFQLLADEIDFRAENFQQLQAIFRGCQQLIELDQGLVEQACGFTDIGFWQAINPLFQITGTGFAE